MTVVSASAAPWLIGTPSLVCTSEESFISANIILASSGTQCGPAVVAMDPMFTGDEAGFCAAYGAGSNAPDLLAPRIAPTP